MRRTPRNNQAHFGKEKRRCKFDLIEIGKDKFKKCNKRAKDYFEGQYLCRIHSPLRDGYNRRMRFIK